MQALESDFTRLKLTVAELEIQMLKGQKPMQGPPPDMNHLRGGYTSPSEMKRAAQKALLESLRVVVGDEGKN